MKTILKEISSQERLQMSKNSVKDLKSVDEAYNKLEFCHIPVRKTLEF